MPKFRYNIGYEVNEAEFVIDAETKDEADRKLELTLLALTPCEAKGGVVIGPWVNTVEEVDG